MYQLPPWSLCFWINYSILCILLCPFLPFISAHNSPSLQISLSFLLILTLFILLCSVPSLSLSSSFPLRAVCAAGVAVRPQWLSVGSGVQLCPPPPPLLLWGWHGAPVECRRHCSCPRCLQRKRRYGHWQRNRPSFTNILYVGYHYFLPLSACKVDGRSELTVLSLLDRTHFNCVGLFAVQSWAFQRQPTWCAASQPTWWRPLARGRSDFSTWRRGNCYSSWSRTESQVNKLVVHRPILFFSYLFFTFF